MMDILQMSGPQEFSSFFVSLDISPLRRTPLRTYSTTQSMLISYSLNQQKKLQQISFTRCLTLYPPRESLQKNSKNILGLLTKTTNKSQSRISFIMMMIIYIITTKPLSPISTSKKQISLLLFPDSPTIKISVT